MPVSFVYRKQLGDTEETLLKPIKELKGLTNKSRTAGGRQAKEEGGLEPKRQGFQSFFQLSELGSAWLAGLESGVPQLQMSRSCNKEEAPLGPGGQVHPHAGLEAHQWAGGATCPARLDPTCCSRLQPP